MPLAAGLLPVVASFVLLLGRRGAGRRRWRWRWAWRRRWVHQGQRRPGRQSRWGQRRRSRCVGAALFAAAAATALFVARVRAAPREARLGQRRRRRSAALSCLRAASAGRVHAGVFAAPHLTVRRRWWRRGISFRLWVGVAVGAAHTQAVLIVARPSVTPIGTARWRGWRCCRGEWRCCRGEWRRDALVTPAAHACGVLASELGTPICTWACCAEAVGLAEQDEW